MQKKRQIWPVARDFVPRPRPVAAPPWRQEEPGSGYTSLGPFSQEVDAHGHSKRSDNRASRTDCTRAGMASVLSHLVAARRTVWGEQPRC
jgi:hypothetical protein